MSFLKKTIPFASLRKYQAAAFAAAAALLLLHIFLPPAAVWITDNGNKYMIMRNFAENGTVAIANRCMELFPCGGFHFVKHGDEIRSFHSEVLPVITSYIYRIAGEISTAWIPLISTLLILLLMAKYCRRSNSSWGLILTTPFLFYSVLLWEMTPSALFALAALLLLFKRRYILCGAMLGCGMYMREELYMLCAAVGAALLLAGEYKGLLKCALSALITVIPLWMINLFSTGHILGFHGANYALHGKEGSGFSLAGELQKIKFNFYQHGFRFESAGEKLSAILAGAAALLLIIAGWHKEFTARRKFKIASLVIFAVSTAILTAALWNRQDTLYISGVTMGLVPSLPLAAGFFLNWRALWFSPRRSVALAARISTIYIVIVPPLLTDYDIGLTWGARHFMLLMPVLVILSIHALHAMRLEKKLFITLLTILTVIGSTMQLYALRALVRNTRMTAEFEELMQKQPEKVIVSDLFFLPEQTPHLFFDKEFLELASPEQLPLLLEHLEKHRIRQFILLLGKNPSFRRLPNEVLRQLITRYPVTQQIKLYTVAPGLEVFAAICRKQ